MLSRRRKGSNSRMLCQMSIEAPHSVYSYLPCLAQQAPRSHGHGIDAQGRQAVMGGAAFGRTQVMAAIETGHAGQVLFDHNGSAFGMVAGVWSPGVRVGEAKDRHGRCANGGREMHRTGVVADKEVGQFECGSCYLERALARQAARRDT